MTAQTEIVVPRSTEEAKSLINEAIELLTKAEAKLDGFFIGSERQRRRIALARKSVTRMLGVKRKKAEPKADKNEPKTEPKNAPKPRKG